MVDPKKPTPKPAPSTTTAVPATAERRPALPSLTPLPGEKPEAADAQAPTPAAVTTTSEKAAQPASAPAEATTAPAPASKTAEVLGPKLRAKGEIIAALRANAHVQRTESGLYRVVEVSGTVHPASKRRILALIEQGIFKASDADKRKYVLDAEADAKAQAPKPTASTPVQAKNEPSTSTKPEETK